MTETKERSKTAASGRIICSCWSGLVFRSRVSEDIFVDYSFVQRDIHRVPCGHEVIVVINLHKILELWPLSNVLLLHGSCHFSGIAVNSSHQRVWLSGQAEVPSSAFFMTTALCQNNVWPGPAHLPGFHKRAHFDSSHLDLQQKGPEAVSLMASWNHCTDLELLLLVRVLPRNNQ